MPPGLATKHIYRPSCNIKQGLCDSEMIPRETQSPTVSLNNMHSICTYASIDNHNTEKEATQKAFMTKASHLLAAKYVYCSTISPAATAVA